MLLFLLLATHAFSQNCTFNYYNKKGGHYLFSTYYESDMMTRREGVCESFINGKLYERRVFSNGRIIEEELNHIDLIPRVRYKLDSNPRDSIISVLTMYNEKGTLTEKWIFYENKEKRRCQKTIQYGANGKEHYITHRAWVKDSEIDQYLRPNNPPHTIDEEGYTSMSVPFGEEIAYHSNGKLASINYHRFVITYYPDEVSKEGPMMKYFDNEELHDKGQYKDGKAEGKFLNYYPTGEISEEKYFHHDVHVGTWKGWYMNGKPKYLEIYDSLSRDPFNPSVLKWWNENGVLVKERIIDRDGKGYEKIWYDDGKPMMHEDIIHFQRYDGERWDWSQKGLLIRYQNKSPKADTVLIVNFEDGSRYKLTVNKLEDSNSIYEEKEWYPDGILKIHVIAHRNPQDPKSERKEYYPNGKLCSLMIYDGKLKHETTYYRNDQKKREIHYLNNLIEGNYLLYDSLGQLRVESSYTNGLRNGTCTTFDSLGKVIHQMNYLNGCPDHAKKNTVNLRKRTMKDLDDQLSEMIMRTAIQLHLMNLNTYGKTEMIPKERIDSTAQQLLYLYDEWNSHLPMDPFPFENENIVAPKFTFILPAAEYGSLSTGDLSHPNTQKLLHVFDSLGWVFPTDWKLTGTDHIATFTNGNIYNHHFLNRVFQYWYHRGQVDFGPIGQTVIDYGLRWRTEVERSVQFGTPSGSPCVQSFDVPGYSSNGVASFLVYDDGTVEFRNCHMKWEDMKYVPVIGYPDMYKD